MGKIACATAMGLGTAVGGWKIIKTVGGNIMKIRPANGAAADLSSALTIFVASSLHFPLSTTHVVSSSILGVVLLTVRKALNGVQHNVW